MSDNNPLATLARVRASLAPNFAAAHRHYRPSKPNEDRPGGNLDDPATLRRVLPAAVADGEVMLLFGDDQVCMFYLYLVGPA